MRRLCPLSARWVDSVFLTHTNRFPQTNNIINIFLQGDSGGPLVYTKLRTDENNTKVQGERILIGVASFVASPAFGGCHSGMPAGILLLTLIFTHFLIEK